jgi:hypothetical protein
MANNQQQPPSGIVMECVGDVIAMAKEGCDIAHCISGDAYMGKGIAAALDHEFCLKHQLLEEVPSEQRRVGCTIEVRREVFPGKVISIFNMVTKRTYRDLPTYETMRAALVALRGMCDDYSRDDRGGHTRSIGVITMPRIGCGLDRLEWESPTGGECVKGIIKDVFAGCLVDVRILTLT